MALRPRGDELGDDHPDTLESIHNMGRLLQDQGKLTEAEPYHREALEGSRRVLGDDHPHTLESIDDMGNLLQSQAFVFPMNGDENYGSRSCGRFSRQ